MMMTLDSRNEKRGSRRKRERGGVGNLALKLKTRFPTQLHHLLLLFLTGIIVMVIVLVGGQLGQVYKTRGAVLFRVHIYET